MSIAIGTTPAINRTCRLP